MVVRVGLLLRRARAAGRSAAPADSIGVQPEGRHALQLDLGDDAERAEPDPGRREAPPGRRRPSTRSDRPVGEHERQPADRGGDALAAGSRCRGCRWRWRRRSSAGRCRRGWAAPARAACSAGLSTCSGVPASTRTRPRSRSTPMTPLSPSRRSSSPSVDGERRERVPGAGRPHRAGRGRGAGHRATASVDAPGRSPTCCQPAPVPRPRCHPSSATRSPEVPSLRRGRSARSPTSSPPAHEVHARRSARAARRPWRAAQPHPVADAQRRRRPRRAAGSAPRRPPPCAAARSPAAHAATAPATTPAGPDAT